MEKQYQIALYIRAFNGHAEIARFSIDNDKEEAQSIFDQLLGLDAAENFTRAIRFHLLDTGEAIDTILSTRYCSLYEAMENCKTIIKETFRIINFE